VEDKLREAALAVSSAEGEKVYEDLLKALASILGVEYALISVYVAPERRVLRTLATFFDGRIARNTDYPIAGTPCERAMGRAFGFFPKGVRALFPDDGILQRHGIEGYAASTLNDAQGQPIGIVAVMSRAELANPDLIEGMLKIFAARIAAEVERRAHLEDLRQSEEQYRAIFNASDNSMMIRDADFRIVDVNPAWEAMSGYARAEVVGGIWTAFSDPVEEGPRRALHARALAGEHIHLEVNGTSRDGRKVVREVRLMPIQFRGRAHVLQIGTDITKRKADEERLRANEEQYRAIFDAAADSFVLRDAGFRVVDVNPAYEQMSGRTRAEAIGRHDVTMSDPALAERIRSLHASALAGELVSWEAPARRKSGEAFTIEVRGVPIRHLGQPHVLYIGRDISGRKRAESEREQLEAQLRQAQKMEAIGHLAGGIAHDFNNILQGILGNLTLAGDRQAELGDARLGKYLDRAHHSAQRGRDLIAQMLTFSRGQRGARRLVALPEVVRDAAKLLRSTLPSTIDLRMTLEEELPPLQADPVQLEQVVLNLCINARDAMKGTGAIRIGLKSTGRIKAVCTSCRQQLQGNFVELSVRDTGPGIPAPVMDRMFEPFYSTKAIGKGSGMGLSVAHGIVHEHGGHIVVDSLANERTKFRVLLPQPDASPAEAVPADSSDGFRYAGRPQLAGRVLVVDDEQSIREFMQELLAGWGLEVAVLADGAAARDAVAADLQRYDLVITDQTMPQLTGLALARELFRMRPGLPVILYTGYAEDLSAQELRDAGVRKMVRKPIEPAKLFPLVAAHLPPR
jgi:PAS domain S-box-containing protein